MFGRNSIQGRSLVIHKLKIQDNNMRWVCNNLMPVVDIGITYFMKAIANISGPSVEGMVVLASSDSTSINRISSITVLQILDRSKRGDCCTFSHTFFLVVINSLSFSRNSTLPAHQMWLRSNPQFTLTSNTKILTQKR